MYLFLFLFHLAAMTRSRSGVVGKTTQDFVRKAFSSGLISEQEAQNWLSA